jgi:preprotein translocase subunit SecE
MNAKTEVQSTGMDTVKLMLAVLFLVGGVVGFYVFADEQALWVRLLGLLAVVAVSVLIAGQTLIGRNIRRFAFDANIEVRKVVWPTRQETLQTSLVIFIAVLLTALFLWAVDSILFWMVRALTS